MNKVEIQQHIIQSLKVASHFDPRQEANKRLRFLMDYLRQKKLKTFVLGISGGVDSTVAGRLAQLAVEGLRKEAYSCHFLAVRLPYGKQADEQDAQAAINFIQPDTVLTVNIKQTCDQSLQALLSAGHVFDSADQQDFVLGNIKARERMIFQYAIAGTHQGLVIGTDHAAEALMGFFTKYGDGASDIVPLYGLNKRRVKKIGEYLEAPASLVQKKPTADLENLKPQRLDEDAYGITYDEIDDFLEAKPVSDHVYNTIIAAYNRSEHKRHLPIMPSDEKN